MMLKNPRLIAINRYLR